MQEMFDKLISTFTSAGIRLGMALLAFFIGRFIIRKLVAFLKKKDLLRKMEPTVASFTGNFINISLNVLLILTVINILGVPMASVITVLGTAGVAVGLSLQGALSNFCGGIMLMFFRPFSVGDYVSAGGEEGTVKSIAIFYTTLTTIDNKRIMIPNGSLMNANITNYSSEENRMVSLEFTCARGEDAAKIQSLMLDVLKADPRVMKTPAPFARLTGQSDSAMQFSARAWCRNEDYWNLYYDLLESIVSRMEKADVSAPAARIVQD